jgi:superfamily II DNA or RNA helicase
MSKTAEIQILDPIECKVSAAVANEIRSEFSFLKEYWIPGPFRKLRKESMHSTLLKNKDGTYCFYTGSLNRVQKILLEKGWEVITNGKIIRVEPVSPFLPGITFRDEQLYAIYTALKQQRGIIQHPTGTGKTLLGCAILSGFWGHPFLWLCHTKDLMYGAAKEIKSFGFDVGLIGDGHAEPLHDVVVSTRQSFVERAEEYGKRFVGVLVDEAHHISAFEGEYARILTAVPAPLRFGLTATMPDKPEAKLAVEGLLGPLLDVVTVNEGNELGIIAKPRIRIVKLPLRRSVSDLKKYADVYSAGVVNNDDLNYSIVMNAKRHVEKGDSVLCIITQIEHGQNLLRWAASTGVKAEFVFGKTDGENRLAVRDALNKKDIHFVICSQIWNEGINIPELNVIMNGAGGKSEIRTLQIIGRGLRKTKEKDEIWIYDWFNPSNKFLISHFGERIGLYCDNEWL